MAAILSASGGRRGGGIRLGGGISPAMGSGLEGIGIDGKSMAPYPRAAILSANGGRRRGGVTGARGTGTGGVAMFDTAVGANPIAAILSPNGGRRRTDPGCRRCNPNALGECELAVGGSRLMVERSGGSSCGGDGEVVKIRTVPKGRGEKWMWERPSPSDSEH